MAKGWHSRGFQPHFDNGNACQFLTWRLADCIAREQIATWKEELLIHPPKMRSVELQRHIQWAMDLGFGSQVLREPTVANVVENLLIEHHGIRYDLHCWVVMPTHVHCLLTPMDGNSISEIVQNLKGKSSSAINRLLDRKGRLWSPDYFDRYIRDEAHFDRVAQYIENNPIKARLCSRAEDWPWSSC